jgi:hypothetical protein
MPSQEVYAASKYLIYTNWETHRVGQSTIAGSLLLDCANTKEEAETKRALYEARGRESPWKSPETTSQYIYIDNRAEWWSRRM